MEPTDDSELTRWEPREQALHAARRERRRVARRPGTSSGGLTPGGAHQRPLPVDLLHQASRRLQVIALLAAALWAISTVLYHLIDRALEAGDVSWLSFKSSDAIVALGIVTSLAFYLYLRRPARDPKRTLDAGLVYMVVNAAIIGSIMHWDPVPNSPTAPNVSWVGVMVLLFAAVLPTGPLKMGLAGALAAAMMPIGMLLARARGSWAFESPLTALTMHYPDFLVVGMSVVISRAVYGLGQQIARARDLGSYELGELIGRGGMGEVYTARHRMLARPAAIKLIRPEILSARSGESAEAAIARFHREANAAAQLQSPHTVSLYDFGATDDGTLYFAMELLEGVDLDTLVREAGPLPAGRVVHILKQVCESLEEAHAAGLVHRDIKPANVHIGRFGLRDDFVKVLDFGLVATIGGAAPGEPSVTAIGTVRGTPAYMAPEMIVGDAIDGRTDLYAVGCVAYYLLTAQLAFDNANGVAALYARLREAPAPPSTRTTQPIPPGLETAVMQCLAPRPADRPATAAALARQLSQVVVPPWTADDATRWWASTTIRRTTPAASSPSPAR